mgnify:FL=1
MNQILSFDASTTTIAFAHLIKDDNGKINLLACDHYNPSKKLDLFPKLSKVQDFIKSTLNSTNCEDTAIEDIILHMNKFTTAQTISTLAILNRTVGLTIFNETGKAPELLNVMKIRHSIKLTKVLPKKEEIPALVETYINCPFPYVYKKKGGIANESMDRADAIAVGLCYLKSL